MKTIRRLYIYSITFVSAEVIVWGLIGLLRGLFTATISNTEVILSAISLVLVGVPIFLIHWLWSKRLAAQDEEEATALLRAVFFYAILLANGIPIFQNLLAILNRALLSWRGIAPTRALLGGHQTLSDNLIAIIILALIFAYFWSQLRLAWSTLAESQNFRDARRLYRFLWMLYGLVLTIAGSVQLIRFLFFSTSGFLGGEPRLMALNGLAFLILGLPLWYYLWGKCQEDRDEPDERASVLRLGIYALLTLGSALTVLINTALLLDLLLRQILNTSPSPNPVEQFGNFISLLIPFAVLWWYYGSWFRRQMETASPTRGREIRRFYLAFLSLAGLVTTVIGLGYLLNLLADILVSFGAAETLRRSLALSLSTLLVGLPYWLLSWVPLRNEALREDEIAQGARRSLVRRAYLYLVLFGSVLGVMGFTIAFVYQTLRLLLLRGEAVILSDWLSTLFLSLLFGLLLTYHLLQVRREAAWAEAVQRARYAQLQVLLLDAEPPLLTEVEAALRRALPEIQLQRLSVQSPAPAAADLLLYPLTPALRLPEWVQQFPAPQLLIPIEQPHRIWAGALSRNLPQQVTRLVRQFAQGEELRQSFQAASIWSVLGYIFAVIIGLELLTFLTAIAIAVVSD